jgi:hypothetical protein
MTRRLLRACGAAAAFFLVSLSSVPVQAQSGPAAATELPPLPSRFTEEITDMITDDVAKGYYTQQQADVLLAQWRQSTEALTTSWNKAISQIVNDITPFASNQDNQLLLDGALNHFSTTGIPKDPDALQQQVQDYYAIIDAGLQIDATLKQSLQPLIVDLGAEINAIEQARFALIQANPSLSADVRAEAKIAARKVADYVNNSLQRSLDADVSKVREAQDQWETNKTAIVTFLTNTMPVVESFAAKYGSDPSKWPASAKNELTAIANGTAGGGGAGASGTGSASGSSSAGGTGSAAASGNGAGTGGSGPGSGYASTAGSAGPPSPGSAPDDDGDDVLIIVKYDSATDTNTVITSGDTLHNGTVTWQGDQAPPGYDTPSPHGTPSGYSPLVEGAPAAGVNGPSAADSQALIAAQAQLLSELSSALQPLGPLDEGGDLNGGSFATIYTGYTVSPGQGGSTVLTVASNQVQTPSSVMTAPTTQVLAPSTQVSTPSTQVNTPSPLISMPSTQVSTPSPLISMPGAQAPDPSLCGH